MKRVLAVLLGLSLTVTAVGCSSKDAQSNSGGETKAKSESKSGLTSSSSPKYDLDVENLSFPLEEKRILKFLTQSSPLAPEDPNDKLIWSRLEDETNIHIDWTNYTWDVFAEKRNLKIASGELPDAIFDAALSDYDILNYAEDGVIVPVEDLIDKYMPHLKEIYDKYPQYRQFVTAPDGHIYTFPWIEELGAGKESIHSIDNIPWINTKWLGNLGLEMPTTTEELTAVLRAFKEQDANGNGDPNDEIPMSFIFDSGGENFVSLLGAFGYGDNWDHTIVTNEGKVIYAPAEDGYKEGLKWISQLYQEGLIDIEALTQDWNTFVAKGSNQLYGLYFTWDMGNVSGFISGDYSKPDEIVADYAPMPALAGPDGHKNIPRTNGFGLDRGRMAITDANENLELTAKWIDLMYRPLQSAQNNWGTYGDDTQPNIFQINEEGTFLSHLPLNGVSPWELRQKTMVAGPLAVLDEYYGVHFTKPDDAAWRLDILKDVYVEDMKMENNYPKVFYSNEDQQTLTNIEVVMNEYMMNKRAEWIQNGGIEGEWDTYLQELEAMGLTKWLEIKQSYYDNFTN